MRLKQGNIPVDLTDLVKSTVDFKSWRDFASQVKDALQEAGMDTTNISIPESDDMVKVEQKPELLREVIVNQNNRISNLESRND